MWYGIYLCDRILKKIALLFKIDLSESEQILHNGCLQFRGVVFLDIFNSCLFLSTIQPHLKSRETTVL